MKYFYVSFQYSEATYCANIAQAPSLEAVNKHYDAKYAWHEVREAKTHEIEAARRKGMPIITIEEVTA